MRIALLLVLLNYLAFGAFIILRPSAAQHLHEQDAAWVRGEFMLNSADPLTYLAARPLYQWNEWHGGEYLSVKVLECMNLPSLLAAGILTPGIAGVMGASRHYGQSTVRTVLFVIFATIQWTTIGIVINGAWRKRQSRGLTRARNWHGPGAGPAA